MSRAVGVAAAIWGVTALISRVLGLVRESVIGRVLGNGLEADAYFASFILPDFLNYLLASGLLSIVFIPLFQGYLARNDEPGAWRSFSALMTVIAVLAVSATALGMYFAPDLVPLMVPGLDAVGEARVVALTRIVFPAQIFHITGGLLSATLQARDRHTLPALTQLVYALGIIVGGLVGQSAEGFAWGVVIGSFLGPFCLVLVGAWRMGMRFRPAVRHADVGVWILRSLPVMLGASVVFADDWIVKHLASGLDSGSIARLQYGRTLMKVPMGIFGMAAGIAAYPSLARLLAQGDRAGARAMLVTALRATWVLSFAAQAALTVAGTEIATVIWGTARFSPEQLAAIGRYTALYCLGLWAWSGVLLLARAFYAAGRTWPPTLVGTLTTFACLPIYLALGDAYGGDGLAAASSIAMSTYGIALGVWALRSLGPGDELVLSFLRLALSCAGGVGLGLGLDAVLPAWPALLRGALTGGLAAGACLGLSWALRVKETRLMVGALTRRLRR